jgi:hypothetical protein
VLVGLSIGVDGILPLVLGSGSSSLRVGTIVWSKDTILLLVHIEYHRYLTFLGLKM